MASGRLRLDHPERVLTLRADVSFGGLDQIIQSSLRSIGQSTPVSWPHGNAEADALAFHFGSLLDPLVAGIRVDHRLLTVQEIPLCQES